MNHLRRSIVVKGYVIALRTGLEMRECDKIIGSIEHFYSHLEIECCEKLGLCSMKMKEAVKHREDDILNFYEQILTDTASSL